MRRRIEITISWITILKVMAASLLAYLLVRLWPLLGLLFLALLIAITLFPVLRWVRRYRWPDWIGILLIALMLAAFVTLFVGILVPTVGRESGEFITKLPAFQQDVVTRMPSVFRETANRLFESAALTDPEPLLKQSLAWGQTAVRGIAGFVIVLVVAVYFVADGERVSHWLLAFLPEVHRAKANEASQEIASVVAAYMVGQLITSLLCGIYAFAMLSMLGVPNAALLAVVAGVFDVLPLIGFFLAVIPALIMAASISLGTAGWVFVLYAAYHLVENYFIVPKVYGDRLRLSTLTVLISCMAAALVAGVVGAIAILPVVASYPIIERIWLKRRLEADTVRKHTQIDAQEHPPS